MQQPRSLAASLLNFALSVLAASLLLYIAAHLVMAVWPVLVIGLLVVAAAALGYRFMRYRDHR